MSEVKNTNKNIFCFACEFLCFGSCGTPYKAGEFNSVSPGSTTAAGIHSNALNRPITEKEDSEKKSEKQLHT